MRVSLLSLLAVALVAAGCGGHAASSPTQLLRTCVDRWNQGNMAGWGAAPANIAFRRPLATERAYVELPAGRQCIVAIAGGDGTFTCVLTGSGAYWCPHEAGGPPLVTKNATIDKSGVLALQSSLGGTKPTPLLAWQRYPHVDGVVEPWTSHGTLRPGLRFVGEERGRCFVVAETVRSGLSCLRADMARYDACFPARKHWRAGDLAACGALGDTTFVRWTITGR